MSEMNIISAKYNVYNGENVSINAVIDGETVSVPLYPGNRHYDAIMRAVEAEELTVEDAD